MKILIYIGVGIVTLISVIGLIAFISGSQDRLKKKFFNAIRSGDLDFLKKLLTKKGITVKTKDINGLTPLTIAASQGNIEIARLLIDNKADVNSTGGRRNFPVLMFAVTEGQTEMVKFLIDRGVDVNAVADNSSDSRYKNGITALMMAVAKGNNQIVELLIDKGADVDAKGAWEITTGRSVNLQYATSFAWMSGMDAKQTVDYLFEQATKEYPAEAFFKPPLLLAIENGKSGFVEILLKRGADPNWIFEPKDPADWTSPLVPGMNALMYAAYRGEVKAIELLIAKGLDVNIRDNSENKTALWYAIYGGAAESVKFLVNAGAERVKENGQTDLIEAAMLGQNEIIKALIELGSDVNAANKGGSTALLWAATNGHIETVKLLVDLNAVINEKEKTGWTALMGAARSGSSETVRFLVEQGADIHARMENGKTAVSVAGNFPEIVRFLVEQGAEAEKSAGVSAQNKESEMSLTSAVTYDELKTVKSLLDKGADVNARTKEGDTALLIANRSGGVLAEWNVRYQIIELLLDKGADVHAKNEDGNTPLLLSVSNNTYKITE